MLQFVREIPIRIVIQGALSYRRGFLFHVAAGFNHEVDVLSGMSVNLMDVDLWLAALKKELEKEVFHVSSESFNSCFAEIMSLAQSLLSKMATEQGVTLASLTFREERGSIFSWDCAEPRDRLKFTSFQYVESFSHSVAFQLLRCGFVWQRAQGCEADYSYESFRLLKSLSNREAAPLPRQLEQLIGVKLNSGSTLMSVQIEYLEDKSKVIF